MKTSITFLFLIIIYSTLTAQVQIGLLGGFNSQQIEIKNKVSLNFNETTSYRFGFVIDYKLNKHFNIQLQPAYSETEASIGIPFGIGPEFVIQLSQLEIPMLFKFETGSRLKPFITWGPVLAVNLDSKAGAELAGFSLMVSADNVTPEFYWGLTFGAGVNYQFDGIILFGEARYMKMLESYSDHENKSEYFNDYRTFNYSSDFPDLTYKGFQLTFGFLLPLDND